MLYETADESVHSVQSDQPFFLTACIDTTEIHNCQLKNYNFLCNSVETFGCYLDFLWGRSVNIVYLQKLHNHLMCPSDRIFTTQPEN